MEVKGRNFLVLSLFVALFLVSATVTLARSERDPVFGVCRYKCEDIRGVEEEEKLGCKQKCDKYRQEKQKREEKEGGQEKERSHSGGGGGGSGDTSWRQNQKGGKGDGEFWKRQQSNNPFVFEDHHFTTRLESEQGSLKVLQKFTDRSDIFQGIEKYRVAFLEVETLTFVIPNHWDADALFFVANGEGTISLINKDSRQNHNIKRGDIFRVPAGIIAYLINRHANERLVLAKILHSISVPGELQTFVSVGGNPQSSFLNAFSTEVLEAALDTDRDSLERLLGQRRQEGMFKKATVEQIRSMSGKDESRTWPFEEQKRPYNVYKKKPSVQNEYGNLHEVDSKDFSDLRDINVAFSLFNITQGSMAGPFYNTKITTVLVVADGIGQFEMACPHLAERAGDSGNGGPSYEKVSSQLKRGTVVVVPAGHPIVIEASGEENLEVIGFGLNSDENEWFPIAGRDNVMSQWEDEAIELTFGAPVNEVQKVIQKQKKKLFFKGPVRGGRAFA